MFPPRLNEGRAEVAVAAGAAGGFPKRPPPKKLPEGAGVLPLAGVAAASVGLGGKPKRPPPGAGVCPVNCLKNEACR